MRPYILTHLDDAALLHGLRALVARERAATAAVLAHIAEVDARKLYLPAAYPSMYAYCVHELRLSEDSALKRIQAARVARQLPAIFYCLAQGRLHLSGIVLLAPYLTAGNADALLEAATHRTKSEIQQLIAERFPQSETLPMVQALAGSAAPPDVRLAQGETNVSESSCQHAPGHVGAPSPGSYVAPIARKRFLLQVSIGQSTHDNLRHAQELLSHEIPSGEIAEVLDRALKLLVAQLEKRKFAATRRPHRNQRPTTAPRQVPAHVKRAVWERDGGRCTFESDSGKRCAARKLLEFDHIDPVARGGHATVANMRLRCRAHNQYAAECEFGAGFMERKRQGAREAEEERRRQTVDARERTATAESSPESDVTPWLRRLGFRADEARRAAATCEAMIGASLEERMRRALSCLRPPARTVAPAARASASLP